MSISTFHPIFIGTVAVDYRYGGKGLISIHPTEELPNYVGALDTNYELRTCTITTQDGTEEVSVLFSSCIEAQWLNRNSPIITCPNVVAGERVLVWRNGDSEEYYWETLGIDKQLRSTEHVIIAVSNTNKSNKSSKYLDMTNSYIIELDTINKKIALSTNKNDGEPFAYDFILNTKAGSFKAMDDVGNHWLLDSANTVIEFLNASGTKYRQDKEDIWEFCKGNKTTEIGKDHIILVHGNEKRTIDKDNTVAIKGKQSSKIDGGTSLKTPTYSCKSNNNSWNTPSSSFSGHVSAASISIGGAAMSFMVIPEGTSTARIGENHPVFNSFMSSAVVGTITGNFQVNGSMVISQNLSVGGAASASSMSAPSCSFSSGNVPPCPASH